MIYTEIKEKCKRLSKMFGMDPLAFQTPSQRGAQMRLEPDLALDQNSLLQRDMFSSNSWCVHSL